MSPATCPECGAEVPEDGSCRDLFHELLALESRLPGGPTGVAHFHAVASYGLQHPDSMGYTAEALTGLRDALAEELAGRISLEDVRRRVRAGANGATRVLRRPEDPPVAWRRGGWSMNVTEVLSIDETSEAYSERTLAWAWSVRETLAEGR